jgi:DNA-binding transcriptional LysR family regulator
MELHQVRYFVALASTLNFTKAAENCNVTQPALTKGVQRLEEELGGQLIYRERQLTQLTELGKVILPMLERTLVSTDAVRRKAQEYRRSEVAPLRIGLVPSVSASLVLAPLAEILKRVPGLRLELSEGSAAELVESLLEGRINGAIVGEIEETPSRIDGWPLFDEPYVAVLSREHHLANRSVITIGELRQATLLERVDCDVRARVQAAQIQLKEVGSSHRSRHEMHLQHMASAGFGIIIAPDHMPHLPSLKKLRIEGDPIWRTVKLLAVQGRRYSPALDTLVRIAKQGAWAYRMPGRVAAGELKELLA